MVTIYLHKLTLSPLGFEKFANVGSQLINLTESHHGAVLITMYVQFQAGTEKEKNRRVDIYYIYICIYIIYVYICIIYICNVYGEG